MAVQTLESEGLLLLSVLLVGSVGQVRYIRNVVGVTVAPIVHLVTLHPMSEEPRTVELTIPRGLSLQTFSMTFAYDTVGPVVSTSHIP